MSTLTPQEQAVQASIPGLQPDAAAPAALPAELPTLCVAGTLVRGLQVRVTTDGAVFLDALLLQREPHHAQLLPVLVVHQWPDGDGLQAAQAAAHRLAGQQPAGSRFGARGRGLELATYHGERVLRLMHSDALLTF
jgi:hypothetical protein